MNKIQNTYLLAKAWVKTLESELEAKEQEYIKANNFTNEDGSVPTQFFKWDVMSIEAEKAIEDFYNSSDIIKLERNICKARTDLYDAENALIEFGISAVPEEYRDTLRKGAKHWKYRKALIDLALKLGTKDFQVKNCLLKTVGRKEGGINCDRSRKLRKN